MEGQNQQLTVNGKTINSQPAVPSSQKITTVNQPAKPNLNLTEDEAKNFLLLNNLQTPQQSKTKPPIKLMIAVVGLVIFAILVSYLAGAFKSSGGSTSSGTGSGLGFPKQSNPTTSSGVTNQVNQDVKACSNPINAATVC